MIDKLSKLKQELEDFKNQVEANHMEIKNKLLVFEIEMQKIQLGQMVKPKVCAFDGCELEATTLAAGRPDGFEYQPKVKKYCIEHADLVAGWGYPEYDARCPNCDCRFGVN